MSLNLEFIIITSVLITLLGILVLKISKKRKRSAQSIYKLIDDLEKKYIY